MAPEEAQDVKELLKYPEGTAGSVMTTEFVALPDGLTAEQTLQRLRHLAPGAEQIYYFYVEDAAHRLVGVLPLRALIVAPPDQRIAEIMTRRVVTLTAEDDLETVGAALTRYDLLALPVVDANGRLIGVVTVDDVMEVVLRKGRRRVPPRFRRRAKPRTSRSESVVS